MLFKNSLIYGLAKAIPALMAFAALSVYTHYLSPEEYGLYTLLLTGTVFIHNVIFAWLPAGTLRFWSSKEHNNTAFLTTIAISYSRILSLLFILSILGIFFYWGQEEATWIMNAFFFLLALALFTITQNLFTAKILPLNYAYLTIGYSTLAISFGGLLAYLGYGATGVITGVALGTLLPALFMFKQTWSSFDKSTYNKDLLKKLLVYGLPIASANLLEELTKVSDRFMLAGLQDKSQAGLYAVGYDLSGSSILMIMSVINLAAYPIIINLLEEGKVKESTDYFRKYTILLLGISVPAVAGLNLVGPDLVYLLIDEQFQESVIFLLPWVTTAIFLMGLQTFYFDLAFQLGHHTIGIAKIGIVIATVNIGLNYWLIPIMGIQGAAIATLSSFILGSFLSAIIGRKYFSVPVPYKSFIKIIIATLVMTLCLWWIKDFRGWGWLLIQLAVGMISYITMIFAFNLLDIRSHVKARLQRK
ncbi:MAG: polysaccharide biosynthesis C-terminal domain-containing protein [Cocleimonas sp.]